MKPEIFPIWIKIYDETTSDCKQGNVSNHCKTDSLKYIKIYGVTWYPIFSTKTLK